MTDITKQTPGQTSRETIDSYVTDMLALEKHIMAALAGQIEDLDEHNEVKGVLIRISATSDSHARTLEQLSARREGDTGGVSKVLKKAVASVLGAGAAAVDFVRTEKVPKDLRDDYAALSLAHIGYVMLYTTALGLGDTEVADAAELCMQQHAESLNSLLTAIPPATLGFLMNEGHTVDMTVLRQVGRTVSSAQASSLGMA